MFGWLVEWGAMICIHDIWAHVNEMGLEVWIGCYRCGVAKEVEIMQDSNYLKHNRYS